MGPGNVVGLQNLIELRSPTNSTGGSPAGSQVGNTNNNGQLKTFMNPVMRSTSSSSGGAPPPPPSSTAAAAVIHHNNLQNIRGGDSRPLSSHSSSRNSEGSSLGK